MATPKPQIRGTFATPVCVHFLPVAQDVNPELRALILERMNSGGAVPQDSGWRSAWDFESWGGQHAQTLFRMVRELADSMTCNRAGQRVNLEWAVSACATVRKKDEPLEHAMRPATFWSGMYFVDDGYGKSDQEILGGDVELGDPRGSLPAMVAPHLAFRIPGGVAAGQVEITHPQSGMILVYPSWLPRIERRLETPGPRITVEFDLSAPPP